MATVDNKLWLLLALIVASCDSTWSLDVRFESPGRGYFLRPLSDKLSNPLKASHVVYIPRSQDSSVLEARLGPFFSRDVISGNHSQSTSSYRLGQYDFSAHVISSVISSRDPTVSTLCHLSIVNVGKNNKRTPPYQQLHQWCFRMDVQRDKLVASATCILSNHDNTCLSTVHLPPYWWNKPKASLHFRVYPVNHAFECSENSNLVWPRKSHSRQYLGSVSLVSEGLVKEYREIREDQHILIDVPTKHVFPESRFSIPVKLQAESDLQHFVVRIKTKFGLRVLDARPVDPKQWQITLDVNHKQRLAMVTAYVTNARKYTKSPSIQEIFTCNFKVDNRTSGSVQVGRIIWTLEYFTSHEASHRNSPYKKLVSRIPIQHDRIRTIVPVVKEVELMNTAMLSGQMDIYPLHVYGVSEAGRIMDITSKVLCYSMDMKVLKVTPPCNNFYLDSSTTRSSDNTSIIIKYGLHTRHVFLKVWVPETPLYVHVDDTKLSVIKGWKVQAVHSRLHLTKHGRKRGADFGLLTYPSLLQSTARTMCQPRYQQTEVKVYARFYTNTPVRKFVVNPKAYVDITDVVVSRLRLTDGGVASLRRNVIQGTMAGHTEIQVRLPNGEIAGSKEIHVTSDKVAISKLEVTLVTGVNLRLQPGDDLKGTYKTVTDVQNVMYTKYQEGILDLTVKLSDGTYMPLSQTLNTDYSLNIRSRDNHVVVFGPSYSNEQPRVIAVGQGKGDLIQVELGLKDSCQRKKYRPLALSSVYVDVNLKYLSYKGLQNDAGNYAFDSRASDHWRRPTFSDVKNKNPVVKPYDRVKPKTMNAVVGPEDSQLDDGKLTSSGILAEPVQTHPKRVEQSMTPLEIGMYILLGVFTLAVSVFLVNCIIYIKRYKKKSKLNDGHDSLVRANEWVWIGKTTLERNLINTKLDTTLMPEENFKGNQSVASRPPSSSEATHMRNSGVSTYRGSECSIRITANPCETAEPPEDDESLVDDAFEDSMMEPEHEYRVLGMTSKQFAEYFANLKESSA